VYFEVIDAIVRYNKLAATNSRVEKFARTN